MPEASQKVAETAENPKTAPKSSRKAGKSREKVAETAEILKTAPKTQLKSRKKAEKK